MTPIPFIDPDMAPVVSGDPAAFIRMAFEGVDLAPLIRERVAGLGVGEAEDAGRILELGLLFQLVGDRERALTCQRAALELRRVYRHPAAGEARLRVLALVTVGDLMANTPFELMIEGRGMEVIKVYLDAGQPWPLAVPDHDLAIMAISESEASGPLLEKLKGLEGRWPRPMINAASRTLELARDRLHLRLAGAPGVMAPPTIKAPRAVLEGIAGPPDVGALIPGAGFPLIVRPVGSHAGRGLERIEDAETLRAYVANSGSDSFYVSPFVDYSSADGLFRKHRIAFFGGRAFLCHTAVSEDWMVHYLNAGMAESPAKRAEEEAMMADFDDGFARRHAQAFQALQQRLGLDYFAIDCAEFSDGSLLIFEADVAMIVHDLDPETLYPYKKRQMRKVFDAFEAFLHETAAARTPLPAPVKQSSAA